MFNIGFTPKIVLIASIVLLSGSCQKEIIPPPGSTSPVFVAEGTFGGEILSLHAGDDDVLMTTETSEVNGVGFYKGTLGNSMVQVELGIFAGDVDLLNPVLPDFGNIHEIQFASLPVYPLFKAVKDSFPNHERIYSIDWKVNGVSKGLNVLEINEPGKYNICAHVTFTDMSQATICNEIIVGFKNSADFQLDFFLGVNNSLQAWVKSFGSPVQSIQWYKDGNLLSNDAVLKDTISYQSHWIRADVVFANGVKRSKTILIDGTHSGKFIYDFTKPGLAPIQLWDYTAKVKVTKNGVDYYSHKTSNADNKIQVHDITYYGLNDSGSPVYILKGIVDVNTKSNSGVVLPLHLDVSFGFAVD